MQRAGSSCDAVINRGGKTGGSKNYQANRVDIFFAVSDRNWVLDGGGPYASLSLDWIAERSGAGEYSTEQRSMQSPSSDFGQRSFPSKGSPRTWVICFMGVTKFGDFDIRHAAGINLLAAPNPHGRPNSDVVRPFGNGLRRSRRKPQTVGLSTSGRPRWRRGCFYEKPHSSAWSRAVKP